MISPTITSVCDHCSGDGRDPSYVRRSGGHAPRCPVCEGHDCFTFSGLDAPARGIAPGSEEKVALLCARYSAGLPLWIEGDAVDPHQPGSAESSGSAKLTGPDGRRLA